MKDGSTLRTESAKGISLPQIVRIIHFQYAGETADTAMI